MSVVRPPALTALPQWQALADHLRDQTGRSLRQRFATQPARFAQLSRRLGDVLVDFSKQRLDADTLARLIDLARARGVIEGIAALAAGEPVNTTEGRAALHIALRAGDDARLAVGGQDVMPEVRATRAAMRRFIAALHSGARTGATGRPIRHVVNLGIGGSDLGPRMATHALAGCAALPNASATPIEVHFVASPDPLDFERACAGCAPEETLFIVSSKSFSTAETIANAHTARNWLIAGLPAGADWRTHCVAVTHHTAAAQDFGLPREACFALPAWVGGRFSLWSAVGLPVAAAHGMTQFDHLLAGAHSMDTHFLSAPLEDNLPVLLALVGVWNIDFLRIPTLAVLPYRHALRHLPAYLQQLEMESNGKCITRAGEPVGVPTAPVVWGCAGPLGQHAFHQLFFQGNQPVAADFVVPVDGRDDAHRMLVTQALAQSAALARGKTRDEAEQELLASGTPPEAARALAAHLACPGDVPSTTVLLPGLTAYTLGQLLALYEHKVFVQGWLWGVNSFDQFGVEYGKRMARDLAGGAAQDASTAGLWQHATALMARADGLNR